ncbi:hypothetical protein OG339_14620 [Streptosporangium sp. NBC_01495]|uniref:hypothetical protein n=1 Tax=Streptosporangium sp. NBC_01495 TaxID=2903899 RepID=UPI002E31D460|nr:hypothetical protein [Streptosporangium sp. NBC_01495]
MSPLTARLTAAALAAALGGTLLSPTPATAAGSAAPAVAPSAIGYTVAFPAHVRRGESLVYSVKVRNRKASGQRYVALIGDFSNRFRRIKVVSKPRSVKCTVKGRDLSCWITSLDKGDSTTVRIRAWAGSRRGTATAAFGVIATSDGDADIRKLRKEIGRKIKASTRIR